MSSHHLPILSDALTRQTALDIKQSFIVQAPAGSGKTSLLVDRYLSLLGICLVPENVLVMTFTNKAVDELITRITTYLQMANDKEDSALNQPSHLNQHQQQTYCLAKKVLDRSNALGWDLLANLERLNIKTIDGLSSTLVATQAVSAQLIPNAIIAQYKQIQIYKQAVMTVLSLIDDLEYQQSIVLVLTHLDNNTEQFINLFASMLAKRDQWLRHIAPIDQSVIKQTQQTGQTIITQHLNQLQQFLESDKLANFAQLIPMSPKLDAKTVQFFAQNKPLINAHSVKHFQALADCCLTKSGTWLTKANMGFTEKDYPLLADKLSACSMNNIAPDFIKQLHQVRQLPSIEFDTQDQAITGAIIEVLKLSSAQLMVDFAQHQAVDFVEIAIQAVHILQDKDLPSQTTLYLDHCIEHILLDEFQDTSYTQFELLKSLVDSWSEPDHKTLFLVGDPMQSIYGFRQAEVGLFLQVCQYGIGSLTLQHLKLSYNFRSYYQVIQANNQLFETIFPTKNNRQVGAIGYHPSEHPSQNKPDHQPDDAIEFYGYDGRQDQEEALQVGKIIQARCLKYPKQSIAVLVRSRTHLDAIIAVLKKQNIAFEAHRIKKLSHNRHVQDLLCLTKALSHLGDKLAWLSILRAPWCGLILNDLLILSDNQYDTIWQAMLDYCLSTHIDNKPRLTEDGLLRLKRLSVILMPVIEQRHQFNLSQTLSIILTQLEVNDYLHAGDICAQAIFLELLSELEKTTCSIDIDQLTLALQDSYESSFHQANIVLMTIASAKGLEFDCIILPGLGKKNASNKSPILPMAELEQGLLFAPIKSNIQSSPSATYQYLLNIAKQKSHHELMRILYVAMTRAKEKIYLLGHKPSGQKIPTTGTLLSFLWHQYQGCFETLPEQTLTEDPAQKPAHYWLYRHQDIKIPTIQSPPFTPELININTQTERYYYASIGTLVHRYLQFHQLGKPLIPKQTVLTKHLQSLGIALDKMTDASIQVNQLLTDLVKADFYSWLFAQRETTQVEKDFFFMNKNTRYQQKITIDRLFIDAGVLWVIDYKTQTLKENESTPNFLNRMRIEHQTQMNLYAQVLATYYDKPIKTRLCLLSIRQLLAM